LVVRRADDLPILNPSCDAKKPVVPGPTPQEGTNVNPAELGNFQEIYLRLGVAMMVGAILGVDRDLHRKPAGLRVLSLVSVGASAITMASIHSFASYEQLPPGGILPTIQGILSGIGFLGAGVILRTTGRDEVHGLTTAASIWVSAILGMTCGLGQFTLCAGAFLLSWTILVVGRYVEAKVLTVLPHPENPPPASNSSGTSQ
jgi:putative Mg2+ transporter-C (MgtC) family protein